MSMVEAESELWSLGMPNVATMSGSGPQSLTGVKFAYEALEKAVPLVYDEVPAKSIYLPRNILRQFYNFSSKPMTDGWKIIC